MQNDVDTSIEEENVERVEYNKFNETYENILNIRPKYYKQTYRTAWEQMPDFKGWLRSVPGQSTRAYCTFCQKTLHAHRLSLLKHTCTIRHQKAAQANFLRNQNEDDSTEFGSEAMETVEVVVAGSSKGESNGEDDDFGNEDEVEEEEEVIEETEESQVHSDTKKRNKQRPLRARPTTELLDTRQSPRQSTGSPVKGKSAVTTHVLDTTKGAPVVGLQVSLYKLIDGRWTYINEGTTNPEGRCASLVAQSDFSAGRYKLHFDVDRYFDLRKQESLYPFIEIIFDCRAPQEHYHIPLLLTPFGYTTYRGQ